MTAIASRRVLPRWRLSAGPGAGLGLYLPETGSHARGLWLGGFVNASADTGSWTLIPELGVMRVVAGEVPVKGAGLDAGVGFARGL